MVSGLAPSDWKSRCTGSLNDPPHTVSSAPRWPHRSGALRKEGCVEKPVSGAAQLGRMDPDGQVPDRDVSSSVSYPLRDGTPHTRNWHRG